MKYPLASNSWDSKEHQAILDTLSKESYTMGSICRRFEKEFAQWTGTKYAVFCNSGSSANLLAMAAMHHDPRSAKDDRKEIITPAVSWSTTYYPIMQMGYKPVFVDVCHCDQTFNICNGELEKHVNANTRAIATTNLLGNPCDYEYIQKICQQHNLYLLEDNCESMGALFKNQKTGTFGDIATHSTFFSHHMSTMEGGICTTDDELIYEILKSLRAHGWVRDVENRELFYKYFDQPEDDFYELFHFVLPGYNFRPTEVQGSIGIEQLKKLDKFIQTRIENAQYLQQRIKEEKLPCKLQKEQKKGISSWFSFGFVFDDQNGKNQAIQKLRAKGIGCRPIVSGNMLRQPVLKNYSDKEFPCAEKIHKNGLMIGNHQFPIEQELDFLLKLLREIT